MIQQLTTLENDVRTHGENYLVFRFVVKKVKGKDYIYLQGRDEQGHVKTIYVGPLEEIAKYYLVFNVKGEAGWWTGRDLNPGPLGCKPSALPS